MTKLGKYLIFINVALSIGMAAFALGLYSNRIEWGGAKPSDSDSEIGRLTTDIKNRQDVLVKAVTRVKRDRADLARLEAFQVQARDFYAKQLRELETGRGGQPVNVLVYNDKGALQTDANGFPALQPGAQNLRGRDPLEQDLKRLEGQITEVMEETKKVMDGEAELTKQLNGQPQGLRVLLAQMQEALKRSVDELKYVRRERINNREAASSLVHRQQQLRDRKETLQKAAVAVTAP